VATKSKRRTGLKAKREREEFESYTLVTVLTPRSDGSGYDRSEYLRGEAR
jgi:hypothetical protein